MSAGYLYELPGGQHGIEVEGSTRDVLRVMPIHPNWPFPLPPITVARKLCKLLPSRYLKGAVPPEDFPEALL